jgi:hypothetical protein
MKPRIAAAALVLAVAFGACSAPGASPSPSPGLGSACAGYSPSNVLREFMMPSAGAYRDYLPKMGKSPELDSDSAPAYMVIYKGPVSGGHGTASNAVCIVQHNGTANLYADVSRDGMALPTK